MGYFFHHKRAPKTKFSKKYYLFLKTWVDFQAYKNLYPSKKWENMRKNIKNLKKKNISVSEKKVSAPIRIPKLDLGFGSRYQNLVC